jgi:8-oxo-dGTP pyrophosphatase MutT (NUDIX family)
MTAISFSQVDELDCRLVPWSWPFAEERRETIAAHWQGLQAERPRLFDGRVLLACAETEDTVGGCRVHRSDWFETSYSAFLGWRDFGFPDRRVRNGFAMAALHGNDGGYVLARMGDHTANPGHIYFACGTPDPDDLRGERLDLEGSALRELMEETSLARSEFVVEAGWTLVHAGPRLAFMKSVQVDMPARDLAQEVERRLARQADPELVGMHVVASPEDLEPEHMPDFILAYLDHVLPR